MPQKAQVPMMQQVTRVPQSQQSKYHFVFPNVSSIWTVLQLKIENAQITIDITSDLTKRLYVS